MDHKRVHMQGFKTEYEISWPDLKFLNKWKIAFYDSACNIDFSLTHGIFSDVLHILKEWPAFYIKKCITKI